MLKKMPIGKQDFEMLRKDGYAYVDKTRLVYQMVDTGCYYFLSRPRRFGKSLLVSTLKAYFEGKREVFEGLEIAQLEHDWTVRPVLMLDLNTNKYDAPEVLEIKLDESLRQWEELYGCARADLPLGMRFENVIRRAAEQTGHRVAILVDEYDKPMLQAIGKPDLQQAYRNTLKGFYGALKSMDSYIKFAFLTGVTKFGKVSVFSDLNNLMDISMDAEYYDICGITQQELLTYFAPEVEALAEANDMTKEECVEKLRKEYDGYHFEETAPGMYNPFSVLNTLKRKKFGSYWFETGTPTYLVTLLRQHDYSLELMSNVQVKADVLNSVDVASTNPIPVIYQSGYLTIKGYDSRYGRYTLGFPNHEVEQGFVDFLMDHYAGAIQRGTSFDISYFVEDVEHGRTEQFVERLRSLFADTPYELVKNLENHYQNMVWLLFKLMGFYVQAEYHTSRGRIDLVVKTQDYCYVMEFKLDGTAEEALEQISSKDYVLPFQMESQQIVRIGMNFDPTTRNIERYLIG